MNQPIWKTEGPTDLLTLLSINPDADAFTTANGAKEKPQDWIVESVAGRQVFIVHDADKPGQEGATSIPQSDGRKRPGWSAKLAESASEVRNVELPYEVSETNGKDLRDFFNEGHSWDELEKLTESSQVINGPDTSSAADSEIDIIEADDDPHRLARVNLHQYNEGHGGKLVYHRDEWWKYKAGRYRKIDSTELRAKVTASIHQEFHRCWRENQEKDKPVQKVTQAIVNNVIGAMASMCSLPSSVAMPSWLPDRSQPRFISMTNGILDLQAVFDGKDDVLRPHSSDWFSSVQLDYRFNLEAKCPKWLKFMDSVTQGDGDIQALLQEWAGYLLTADNDLQRFLVLEGEGGNGKTVYFAAIQAMLGDANVSHVNLENFGDRFALAPTVGKAANISGDVGQLESIAEGTLKQYSGGDTMTIDRKNREPLQVRPTAKLMCSWNDRPRVRDKSRGLWRRMILIPFSHAVTDSERVLGMDSPAWWIRSGEVEGLLLWAIAGLHRLQKQGCFTQPLAMTEAMLEYQQESNPVTAFILDSVQPDDSEDSKVEKSIFYKAYRKWASLNGYAPMNERNFQKQVKRTMDLNEEQMSLRARRGGTRVRFFGGVSWLAGQEPDAWND